MVGGVGLKNRMLHQFIKLGEHNIRWDMLKSGFFWFGAVRQAVFSNPVWGGGKNYFLFF